MKKRTGGGLLLLCFILAVFFIIRMYARSVPNVENYIDVASHPHIKPDYDGIVLPSNIAPLNFDILEEGDEFVVRISAKNGRPIELYCRDGKVTIPEGRWRELLEENVGGQLNYDIYLRYSGEQWKKYARITNAVAEEPLDRYLVFRFIKPIYNYWRDIGVYQRDLSNWDVSTVLQGSSFGGGCLNCHTFLNHRPERMVIGFRGNKYGSGTVLAADGNISKIGSKWGYTSWHPSGRVVAYSINKVRQFFQSAGMEVRDVVDLESDVAYYDIDGKEIKTYEAFSRKDRLETYPTWTPDGKFLYYCSAPIPWKDRDAVPPDNYENVRYDLMRIQYDVETDQWGKPEVVLPAEETGLSILLPRISPDGRFLLFCMCKYGCFPIYQPSSDLYMMDLATGKYWKLSVNSGYSESWHSFSSNGRWISFSSKRRGGLFTRTFFSYIDENGKARKPFILPQKDPEYYDSLVETYSLPELITEPVSFGSNELARAIRSEKQIEVAMPAGEASPGTEASEPWQNPEESQR